MKKVWLLAALVMLVAVPAFAEPGVTDPSSYIQLKLGMYMPQSDDFDDLDFDDEFYTELGFGYYVNKNLALDFGIGYAKPGTAIPIDPTLAQNLDITIIPVTVGVRAILPLGAAEVYASGGLGFYFSKAEEGESYAGVPGNFGTSSDTDTSVGFYLGLGANLNLSRNLFVGIDGKYFRSEDASYKMEDPALGNWYLDLDGILVTGTIGYRF